MNTNRILVAGIGNIFLGDDAFGVETVRSLVRHELPQQVKVVDFGIRGYDLAYALADDSYQKVIMVDAIPRGEEAGTLYLIEPDLSGYKSAEGVVNGHTLNPLVALLMARSLNSESVRPGRVLLVGCEPAVLETENGSMELSAPVSAAVPGAVEMIRSLIERLLSDTPNQRAKSKTAHESGGNHHATLL